MLLFDGSYMPEKLLGFSIFEVDNAISFKNMITQQDAVKGGNKIFIQKWVTT